MEKLGHIIVERSKCNEREMFYTNELQTWKHYRVVESFLGWLHTKMIDTILVRTLSDR